MITFTNVTATIYINFHQILIINIERIYSSQSVVQARRVYNLIPAFVLSNTLTN